MFLNEKDLNKIIKGNKQLMITIIISTCIYLGLVLLITLFLNNKIIYIILTIIFSFIYSNILIISLSLYLINKKKYVFYKQALNNKEIIKVQYIGQNKDSITYLGFKNLELQFILENSDKILIYYLPIDYQNNLEINHHYQLFIYRNIIIGVNHE